MPPSTAILAAALLVSLVGGAVLAAACASQSSSCNAPSALTYDCTPSAADAGAVGCVGGPGATYGMVPPDPGKVFPNGCRAQLATCSPIDPRKPETCECEPSVALDGGLDWICPVL